MDLGRSATDRHHAYMVDKGVATMMGFIGMLLAYLAGRGHQKYVSARNAWRGGRDSVPKLRKLKWAALRAIVVITLVLVGWVYLMGQHATS